MLPFEHSKELLNFYFAEQAQKSPRMLCCQAYLRRVGCSGPGSEMLFVGGWAGSYMPQICEETPANSQGLRNGAQFSLCEVGRQSQVRQSQVWALRNPGILCPQTGKDCFYQSLVYPAATCEEGS